jgi:hypothetical protein
MMNVTRQSEIKLIKLFIKKVLLKRKTVFNVTVTSNRTLMICPFTAVKHSESRNVECHSAQCIKVFHHPKYL